MTFVGQRLFGLFGLRPGRIQHSLQLANLFALYVDRCVGVAQAPVFARFFGNHFGQAGVDLLLPLAKTIERL